MKTISGSVLASKPITLSKAASSMNNFLTNETGAPTAISSYLRRSAAAFNELVHVHKELKGVRSERKHKHKKSRLETFEENHEENNLSLVVRGTDLEEEQSVWYPANSELGSVEEEGRTKERKKKKRKQTDQIDEVERESGGHVEIEVEEIKETETEKEKEKKKKKKKKKKRKKPVIEDECLDDSEERHRMKKKKRKHEIKT